MDGDGQDEGFAVVTVAMDSYVDTDRFAEVHEVVAEAGGVAGLLGEWGGEHRVWKGEERTLAATQVRLREWSAASPPRNSMLLWFGHGESNEDDALLAVRGAGTDGEDDALTPEDLGRHLVRNFRHRALADRWAVVVVEACGAARFVEELLAYVLRQRAAVRLLLIGSGADQGSGYVASFREVLTRVLAEFSDNYSHIRLRDLAQRIQDLLSPGRVLCLLEGDEQVVRRHPAGRPVIMTLEDYARPRGEPLPSRSRPGPCCPSRALRSGRTPPPASCRGSSSAGPRSAAGSPAGWRPPTTACWRSPDRPAAASPRCWATSCYGPTGPRSRPRPARHPGTSRGPRTSRVPGRTPS